MFLKLVKNPTNSIVGVCQNFTIEEWESDILYLIRKQEYNTKLRDLQDKAEKLKKYYSDDRQADIAVNDILDSL